MSKPARRAPATDGRPKGWTLSDEIRAKLEESFPVCKECKRPTVSVREMATRLKVSHVTLRRFLAGSSVTTKNLDTIAQQLGRA